MAYQALYRKWRPLIFEDVYGQDAIVTTLKNQIKADRVGHAYLFCGTRGTGKTTLAKIFARAVNCPHAAEHEGSPCNECAVCRGILDETSMNVFEIDAASNNSVDDVRRIKEETEYPPVEGRYKVYIIDEVHMLSTSAFNALLKTLEEPPAYVIFILATTDPQKVPATILSRCQRYDLRRIGTEVIEARLSELCAAEGRKAEDRALSFIARSADGSMRDALSLLDRCLSFLGGGELSYNDALEVIGAADITSFSELYRAICSADIETALRIVADTARAGREMAQFTNDMIWYLRNVLLSMSADDVSDILDASEEDLCRFREDSRLSGKERLIYIMSSLAELSNRMRFAPQKRTLLEVELIRLCAGRSDNGRSEQGQISARQEVIHTAEKAGETPAPARPEQTSAPEKEEQKPSPVKIEHKPAPMKAEQNIPAKKDVPEPEPVKQEIRQTAAQGGKGSIEEIRRSWASLVPQLAPSNRYVYENAVVKEEGGRPVVIFRSAMNFKIASTNKEENGLTRLSELCREQLSLDVRFGGRVARKGEIEAEADHITDEDLSRINFPVEIEG